MGREGQADCLLMLCSYTNATDTAMIKVVMAAVQGESVAGAYLPPAQSR